MKRRKTKIIHASGVCAIDFAALRDSGITCILFDIEGTLTQWGDTTVHDEIVQCVRSSGITNIGLVSNMDSSKADRLAVVARQVGATSYHCPHNRRQRKPRPYMLEACMRELGTTPDTTVLVGDKIIDVLAAKNTRLPYAVWLAKLPGRDHWFDRWIYRRIEPLLKKLII